MQSKNLEDQQQLILEVRVVFQPFEEVKKEQLDIPVAPHVSLARQIYADDCEAAINELINVECNISYVYHSLYAYFDNDNRYKEKCKARADGV
ncbi:hypothetical protein REPUB_Repub02eG0238300 [Reevesia pubescens]